MKLSNSAGKPTIVFIATVNGFRWYHNLGLPFGVWNQIVMNLESETMQFYLNGRYQNARAGASQPEKPTVNPYFRFTSIAGNISFGGFNLWEGKRSAVFSLRYYNEEREANLWKKQTYMKHPAGYVTCLMLSDLVKLILTINTDANAKCLPLGRWLVEAIACNRTGDKSFSQTLMGCFTAAYMRPSSARYAEWGELRMGHDIAYWRTF